MLPIPILCLCLQTPAKVDPPKITAVVEEVYRIDSQGKVTAFDSKGATIPHPTDPSSGRGQTTTVPAGQCFYRVVLKLTSESSLPSFGRTYVEGKDHARVEVPSIEGTGTATGIREILSFSLPADQVSTTLHAQASGGPYETFLDEAIDDDHPGGLTKVEGALAGGSQAGPMDAYRYDMPPDDVGRYDERGIATFEGGTKTFSVIPLPHIDPASGQVLGQTFWFSGARGKKPTHLLLKRRPYQKFEVGPVKLQ